VALFGNKQEKVVQEAAAKAEVERLQALSAVELAEALMPAFGPEGARSGAPLNNLQVASWLMSSFPRSTKYLTGLREPILEGLQDLVNAGLIVGTFRAGQASMLKATRLGEEALAQGDIPKYLES
jgi:hypothetical protein